MQIGAPTVESSMEIPQKVKNGSAFPSRYPTSGDIPRETQNINSKGHKHPPKFIAVLFTITKMWKQHKCPPIDEWIKQLWDIYTMEYYLAIKKKKILPFANSMDGPGKHYTK